MRARATQASKATTRAQSEFRAKVERANIDSLVIFPLFSAEKTKKRTKKTFEERHKSFHFLGDDSPRVNLFVAEKKKKTVHPLAIYPRVPRAVRVIISMYSYR